MSDAKMLKPEVLVRTEHFNRWVNVLAENDNIPAADSVVLVIQEEPIEGGLLSFY
jgi:hypothetical protein